MLCFNVIYNIYIVFRDECYRAARRLWLFYVYFFLAQPLRKHFAHENYVWARKVKLGVFFLLIQCKHKKTLLPTLDI